VEVLVDFVVVVFDGETDVDTKDAVFMDVVMAPTVPDEEV